MRKSNAASKNSPRCRYAHDAIVALVERMLKLKKDLQATNELDAERRAELQERIARMDEEIDDAVFGLYELSEGEKALVRGTSAT